MEKRKDLLVAALESGTVIDHIPTDKVFTIVQLLQLDKCQDQVTIGNNLESQKFGKKGIIKIANRFFSDAEISQLAVVCPNIRLCLIKDYEVVEKKQIVLPDELDNVVGGNDDKNKKKKNKEGIPWDCPFCGAHITLYQFEDGPKHMTKCPNNPYK